MGKYQKVREIVRNVLEDGKAHTAEELHRICESNGIEVSRNRSEIYNIVHQLKVRGEIVSDEENRYILVVKDCGGSLCNTGGKNIEQRRNMQAITSSKFDSTDFEIVNPAIRKEAKQVISVFDNGDLAINGPLRKVLKTNQVELRIKKDCSQILLVPNGTVLLDITKNNRIKNYRIYEKLKSKKMKFPVYYVGEWNKEDEVWLGDLVMTNPNKTTGKVVK